MAGCGRFGFDATERDSGAGDDATTTDILPPPRATDGTRLRAVYYASGDDSGRVFDHWFDTQLSSVCYFFQNDSGELYCVPVQLSSDRYFADATCTARAATVLDELSNCYGTLQFADPKDFAEVRAIGAPIVTPLFEVTASCSAVTAPNLDGYQLGAVVPNSTFVHATTERTRAGDYSYIELVAEDGARELQPLLYDHVAERECSLSQSTMDEGLCVDASYYATPLYRDASCTDVVIGINAGMTPPRTVRFTPSSVCSPHTRIVELGARVNGPLYLNVGAGCAPVFSAFDAYEVGPERTSELPTFHRTFEGTGRLQTIAWRNAAGNEIVDTLRVRDTLLDTDCSPIVDAAGTTRCVPTFSQLSANVYADAACSMPVLGVPSCLETEQSAQTVSHPGAVYTCAGVPSDVYGIDAASTGSFYELGDHGCVAVDASAGIRLPNSSPMPTTGFAPLLATP